uniref:DUF962 domain-containing protein n=1 Tax=Globisporangium ultimum (strain ATCC 200006 / CBS 805.95 / DAOM BR144) TaxID=431595 RepID=K3WVH9_GLOUD
MGRISDRFNLEKQLVFYLSYHDNNINQYIHFMCIWPILLTALIMFADVAVAGEGPTAPLGVDLGLPFQQYLVLNGSTIITAVYMVWYVLLDPIAGSLGASLVFGCFLIANWVSQNAPLLYGVPGWKIGLPIHCVAWTLQFIGHGVFERRKPALLDSLDQALITAPMFVLLEALFPLGYRQELYKKVEKQAKLNVKLFRAGATAGKTL